MRHPFVFFGIEADGIEVPEPVAAVGRAEEEGAAACGDEHGADDLGPGVRINVGGFVEDDEIETFAAQVIGIEGAADGDHAAVGQIDAAFSFAYVFTFGRATSTFLRSRQTWSVMALVGAIHQQRRLYSRACLRMAVLPSSVLPQRRPQAATLKRAG